MNLSRERQKEKRSVYYVHKLKHCAVRYGDKILAAAAATELVWTAEGTWEGRKEVACPPPLAL